MKLFPPLARLVACAIGLAAISAQAQVTDPYNYTRTTTYTYDPTTSKVATQTREPTNGDACVLQSYGYDAYGNLKTDTLKNCGSPALAQKFLARSSTSDYAAPASQVITVTDNNNAVQTPSVTYPSGLFETTTTNALQQSEHLQVDPRFGAILSQTGPNGLTTTWVVDDFGRKTQRKDVDGTSVVWYYCMLPGAGRDTSANSPGCPSPAAGEVPADAASFMQSEPRDVNGTKDGPFTREYQDRLGRIIRVVTQGFDGATQPNGLAGGTVVQDTVYSAYGVSVLQTQPYFLATGTSTASGSVKAGVTMMEYDVLGRPTAQYVADPEGQAGAQTFGGGGFGYGAYGSQTAAQTRYAYSGLTTTATNDKDQARTEERNAIGETVRVTDATGAQIAYQRDAFGHLVGTKDALQNTIGIAYDIAGRKTQLNDPDAGLWLYCYDALGQLTAQQNALMRAGANPGACPSAPNGGATANPVAGWTTFAYDALGRLTQRAEPEYTTTWSYDTYADGSACNKGAGKLCESKTSNGVDRKHVYDSIGREASQRTDIASGPSFAAAVAYNPTTGSVSTETYPTGLQVGYAYTALGYLQNVNLLTAANLTPLPATPGGTPPPPTTLAANSLLWQAQAVNAWGQVEQQRYGNGLTGKAVFEAQTGRVSSLTAGAGSSTSVLNQHYDWDSLDNLTGRIDANGDGSVDANGNPTAVSETFNYEDKLNRLTRYSVSSAGIVGYVREVALQYNALGMLLYKSDVGNYAYGAQGPGAVRPHALLSVAGAVNTTHQYDANGNLKTASAGAYRSIGYTSFNLPDSQTGASGPQAAYSWQYDERHARIKEVRSAGGNTRTLWYLHPDNEGGLGFEVETDTSPASQNDRHFISAGGQVVGVLVSSGNLPTLAASQTAPAPLSSINLVKVEYWHQDNLGSLITTTDHLGYVTARYAYDPFGKRRYGDGNYDGSGSIQVDWTPGLNQGTARGFTGHEHLDDVGLVNMNGRVFDPNLGVFVQADAYVTDPGNLQSFGRYSYCLNNPLTCTDPSGFADEPDKKPVAPVDPPPLPQTGRGIGLGWISIVVNKPTTSTPIVATDTIGIGGSACEACKEIKDGNECIVQVHGHGNLDAVGALNGAGTPINRGTGAAGGDARFNGGPGKVAPASGATGASVNAAGRAAPQVTLATAGANLRSAAAAIKTWASQGWDALTAPLTWNDVDQLINGSPAGQEYHAAELGLGSLVGIFVGETRVAAKGLGNQNPLYKAAVDQFKNTELSNAGRALTKHPELIGETKDTLRQALRTDGAINDAAHGALRDIMRNGVTTTPTLGRYGTVTQIQIPGGFGARWASDGSFIGFINP